MLTFQSLTDKLTAYFEEDDAFHAAMQEVVEGIHKALLRAQVPASAIFWHGRGETEQAFDFRIAEGQSTSGDRVHGGPGTRRQAAVGIRVKSTDGSKQATVNYVLVLGADSTTGRLAVWSPSDAEPLATVDRDDVAAESPYNAIAQAILASMLDQLPAR